MGRCSRPRAISSRRFMPPEKVADQVLAALEQIDELQQLVDARAAIGARDVVEHRVELQVLSAGQALVERRVLEDEADRAPDLGLLRRDVEPGEPRRARGRPAAACRAS